MSVSCIFFNAVQPEYAEHKWVSMEIKRLLLAFYYTNYKFKYSNHWIVNPRLILIFFIFNRKSNMALTTGHGWFYGV